MSIALECTALPLSLTAPRLAAVIHLASLITDQEATGSPLLINLPASVLQSAGLTIEKLQAHTPNADSFCDISMLQA